MFNDSYDIDVSTRPLAEKMSEITQQVGHTTAAVGVMETAVIAQERSTAGQICGKLDAGFFNVVMSQIAQRVANESAQAQALAVELMQQQKALLNLQSRMTGDYNMISARYAKLFSGLNQELRNRVTELDKPLMQYCTQNVKQLENRIYGLVSNVPVLQSESLGATQAIAAARLKSNAQKLIDNVAFYVMNDQQQQHTTQELLFPADADEGQPTVYYVPVIIDEENTEGRTALLSLKENPQLHQQLGDDAYLRTVQTLTEATESMQWVERDETIANVANSYMEMVEKAGLPPRVRELMEKMFDAQFKTL